MTNSTREAIERTLFRRATPDRDARGVWDLVRTHGSRATLEALERLEARERKTGKAIGYIDRKMARDIEDRTRQAQITAKPVADEEKITILREGELRRGAKGELLRTIYFSDGSYCVVYAASSWDEDEAKRLGI
jgi:hypothetical protein